MQRLLENCNKTVSPLKDGAAMFTSHNVQCWSLIMHGFTTNSTLSIQPSQEAHLLQPSTSEKTLATTEMISSLIADI